ncbi:MAG: molecular chaperone DnaJ [Betaproteobacteria bacterium]|nr:molecular chaperone DnaJ [Betaproteobacteria bacterium]
MKSKSSNDPQASLFPGEPAPARQERPSVKSRLPTAHIVAETPALLSKDQKAFNNLLKKIEVKRNLIAEWETAIPAFKQRYTKDLLPLQEQKIERTLETVRALDEAHDLKGITKTEKKKLGVIILNLVEEILEWRDDAECKALYAKYSQSDFDEEQAAQRAAEQEGARMMLESIFGMDLDSVDLGSAENAAEHIAERFLAREEERQAKRAKRKKTAKQLEREAQQAEEEKQISQSIREVYRKLVGALHPDRETDPEEKRRKTEFMQQANEAYAKGNLLELLELQLRLEHIDRAHLAALDPQKLKRYIQILKDQLDELELESRHLTGEFAAEFSLSPYSLPAPKHLTSLIDKDIRSYEYALELLETMLAEAKEPQRLKTWLKTVRLQRTRAQAFEIPF